MRGKKIDELWAWVAVESDGTEGVIAMELDDRMMPLVGGDKERIESWREHAVQIAKKCEVELKLVCFRGKETVEYYKEP